MSRYDWPDGPVREDDGAGRARFNARFRPAPDVRNADGSLDPIAAPEPSGFAAAPPSAGGFVWLPIGPSTVTGGQATGRPDVSGRIRDLAVEPTTGGRLYAASAAGGVWFSGDRGVSWKPIDQFVVSPGRATLTPVGNALATGAVHVLWGGADDGSADEVFVGTGEPGFHALGAPGGHVAGIGVLQATGPATGASWTPPAANDALRGEAFWRITDDGVHRRQLLAGTTDGMYVRDTTGAWTRELHFGGGEVLDVVVLRTTSPARTRVFYALRHFVPATPTATGHTATELCVAEVANPPAAPTDVAYGGATIQKVALPGFATDGRIRLALSGTSKLWVIGVQDDHDRSARLAVVDPSAALASMTATVVTGVPASLFRSASDQSGYDMAIATHPTRDDRLYVGGATELIDGTYNASLYRLEVTEPTKVAATKIGGGVHADVHAIVVTAAPSAANRSVWVGCDGGVFLSDRDGDPGTFVSRNNALATLQPGFVACHPTNAGLLAAGFQDNGTCDRVGDTVWRERFEGDGGGVVYDPGADNRYFRQYTQADWASSDGNGTGPVHRFGSLRGDTEGEQSLFYSGAASLTHGGTTHLVIGTNRLWWSPDWGDTWATVPTGTDPRAPLFPDLVQDVLAPTDAPSTACCTPSFTTTAAVLGCRLQALPDLDGRHRIRLYALWTGGIAVFEASRATDSNGAWTWRADATLPIRAALNATEQTSVTNGDPTTFLPFPPVSMTDGSTRTSATDLVPHDPTKGAHGSCYVTAAGNDSLDTLWWYDGDGHVVPCGVRNGPHGTWTVSTDRIKAPALAVAVHPTDPSVVFVGTSVGVVRGVLAFTAGQPSWTWTTFDNGLPEAAVQDLAPFHDGELTLLRAALQARGVWEVDLAAPVTTPATYLRVYASDTRRRRTTPLTGPATRGEPALRYDASPDIVVDTTALVWPVAGPGEGDLFDGRFAPTVGEHAAQRLSTRTFRVHVLVHDRWYDETPPGDVQVALLRRVIDPPGADVPVGALWPALVQIAGGGAVPNPLPDAWRAAGATLTRALTAPLSARIPRAATFDVDLSALEVGARVLLLAVVMNSHDPIGTADATLADNSTATDARSLVLNSRHVAARSLLLR